MDLLSTEIAHWLIAAWVLFLGGAVGSFLNVVVYRLPAGMSISWPGSHCPQCKHRIRAHDNVPVLAWLWLGGRCRDCRARISARYPLVEAVTAGLFLLLLVCEVFDGGQNLPVRIPQPTSVPYPYPPEQILSIYLLHLGLLCTLMASGLIRWDGKCPPQRLFLPLLLVGFIAPTIWPWLHPLPAWPVVASIPWGGAIDSLLGAGTAILLDCTAGWLRGRLAQAGKPAPQIAGESLVVGAVLGWQAAVVLVPLTFLLGGLAGIAPARWAAARRFGAAVWFAPLALAWILNWARIAIWLRPG